MSCQYGAQGYGTGEYGAAPSDAFWSTPDDERFQYAALASDTDTIYVAGLGTTVAAVDRFTGTSAWQFDRTGSLVDSSPAIDGERLYVGSGSGTLYALALADGTPAWTVETNTAIASSPTVVSGTVFVGTNDGRLLAIDADTGATNWSTSVSANVYSTPAVTEGTVFVTAIDGSVTALAATDGSERWRTTVRARTLRASPVVAPAGVVVAGTDLQLLDTTTGDTVWTIADGGSNDVTPLVESGTIYATDQRGTIRAVTTDSGQIDWSQTLDSSFHGTPLLHDGRLYVGTDDGDLVAFDPETGAETNRWYLGGRIMTPIVTGSTIDVPTWDGTLREIAL